MEEPQIIHYYNELPNYAIIINNLNDEYEELITNYIKLEDKGTSIRQNRSYQCKPISIHTSSLI